MLLPHAGANNYLGLSNHPDVVAAARKALDTHGFGLSSVRFICGSVYAACDRMFTYIQYRLPQNTLSAIAARCSVSRLAVVSMDAMLLLSSVSCDKFSSSHSAIWVFKQVHDHHLLDLSAVLRTFTSSWKPRSAPSMALRTPSCTPVALMPMPDCLRCCWVLKMP